MTLYVKLLLALAALAALYGLYAAVKSTGRNEVITEVLKGNEKATSKSLDHRSAYELCDDSGLVWDYRAGKCTGRKARGGN